MGCAQVAFLLHYQSAWYKLELLRKFSYILLYVAERLVTLKDLWWILETRQSVLGGTSGQSLWLSSCMEMVGVTGMVHLTDVRPTDGWRWQ